MAYTPLGTSWTMTLPHVAPRSLIPELNDSAYQSMYVLFYTENCLQRKTASSAHATSKITMDATASFALVLSLLSSVAQKNEQMTNGWERTMTNGRRRHTNDVTNRRERTKMNGRVKSVIRWWLQMTKEWTVAYKWRKNEKNGQMMNERERTMRRMNKWWMNENDEQTSKK